MPEAVSDGVVLCEIVCWLITRNIRVDSDENVLLLFYKSKRQTERQRDRQREGGREGERKEEDNKINNAGRR